MLLNIVTDDQLLTSQIVKTILIVIIAGGVVFNVFRIFKVKSFKRKAINLILFLALATILLLVVKQYRIEWTLLKHPEYVTGVTTGYCSVFAEGKGISFEYEMNGKRYQNCNTFHPIPEDSIIVPNGKYLVRVAKEFPDEGRMNFRKKAE